MKFHDYTGKESEGVEAVQSSQRCLQLLSPSTHTWLLAGLQTGRDSGAAGSEWQRRLPQRHWDVPAILLWGVPADSGTAAKVGQQCSGTATPAANLHYVCFTPLVLCNDDVGRLLVPLSCS